MIFWLLKYIAHSMSLI